jgi:hypothetical protein
MPIPVLIDRLAEELDALMDETCVYLNRDENIPFERGRAHEPGEE